MEESGLRNGEVITYRHHFFSVASKKKSNQIKCHYLLILDDMRQFPDLGESLT
jgi:hypothetical protein